MFKVSNRLRFPIEEAREPLRELDPRSSNRSEVKFLKKTSPGSGPLIRYEGRASAVMFCRPPAVEQVTPCQRATHGSELELVKSHTAPAVLVGDRHRQLAPFVLSYKNFSASY
jgi:hypothetical protein